MCEAAGKLYIQRFAVEVEDGMTDINPSVAAALKTFNERSVGDWDVVIFEGLKNLDDGRKVDCFLDHARNSVIDQRVRFARLCIRWQVQSMDRQHRDVLSACLEHDDAGSFLVIEFP